MKKQLFMMAACLLLAVSAMSQDEFPPMKGECMHRRNHHMMHKMPPAEKRAEKLAKELNLTLEEKGKVLELFKIQDEKMKAKREEMKREMDKRKAEFEAERKIQDAELEKIIGKEKFQKFKVFRNQERLKQKSRKAESDSMKQNFKEE